MLTPLRGAEKDQGARAALERAQRLAVARGRWTVAAMSATRRALLTSDETLRSGLELLALGYLRQSPDADPEQVIELAERLVIPEQGGGRYAQAVNRAAFEILEGGLMEAGHVARLRELWSAAGSDQPPEDAALLHRYPDRQVEAAVLDAYRDGLDPRRAAQDGALRRWLSVRAFGASGRDDALAWLAAADLDQERDLWAVATAIGLGDQDDRNAEAAIAWLGGGWSATTC